MGFIREAYMMPRSIRKALEGKFPAEIILEVFYAVDDYAYYWDEHRSGKGFDFSYLSPQAQSAFAMVLGVVDKYNAGYYRRSEAQSNNAQIGANKRKAAKSKSQRQTTYYENNREEINRKRREKYVSEKKFRMTPKRKTKNDENITQSIEQQEFDGDFHDCEKCHTKNENVIRNVKRKMSYENAQSQSEQALDTKTACKTKCKTKNENVIRKTSYESPQSDERQAFAENPAMADRITGYCNSSLRSELLHWKGGTGENQVINSAAVDKKEGGQSPTGGLSGSKAVQTGRFDPVCSQAVGGHPAAVGGTPQGAGSKGKSAVEDTQPLQPAALKGGSNAVSGGMIPPPSSARMDCAAALAANKQPKPWLSAPHEPGEHEVKITKGFRIDFTDPIFKPYAAADTTVRIGLESWLKKNKMGCSVEKKWLCKQIVAFSRNQGKLGVLLGSDPPD